VKEKFFSWLKTLNLPSREELFFAFDSLRPKTKKIFVTLIIIFVISSLALVSKLNNKLMTDVPITGGSLTEGVVGSPRFVNPLLATSDVDRDLTTLVYSGLLRLVPGRGYEPDLAESHEISDDGLTYTFHLRQNLRWSDGQKLTADDVVFTIEKAQDQEIKSPKRGSWNGVTVKKVDDQTIQFLLKKPYNFFLENTTLGILPEHLWKGIKPEQFPLSSLNTNPIGSGPYEVINVNKDSFGIPSSYNLKPFKNFALGTPRINLTLRFYNSEKDLLTGLGNGEVGSASAITPSTAEKLSKGGQKIIQAPLPRTFAVFLNQSHNQIFVDPVIREALNLAIDRKVLVKDVLAGYGVPLDSVLPKSIVGEKEEKTKGINEALTLLKEKGWEINTKGELEKKAKSTTVKVKNSKGKLITTSSKTAAVGPVSFTLATANISELKTAAEIIARDWGKLGIKVNVEVFEPGDLNQDVIRPRRYDALLFGEVVGRDYDLYPFWHSSQRLDPGLNIALYANNKVDTLLEEIRESNKIKDLSDKYKSVAEEINKDQPVVFLYQPDFLYAVPSDLKGVQLPVIASPSDRFSGIYRWYFKTDRVWSIFARIASYF
jgi:peptide/nickel transport system substrate-binding protein